MATSSLHLIDGVPAMPQPNDLSRSLVALDQNSTIIAVIEMSQSSWLVAGMRLTFVLLDRRDWRSHGRTRSGHARSAGPNAASGLWACGEVQELPLHPFDAGKRRRDRRIARPRSD